MEAAISLEAVYSGLKAAVSEMPEALHHGGDELSRWAGKVTALVSAVGDTFDVATLKVASTRLESRFTADQLAGMSDVRAVLYRTLATVELRVSPALRGTFIAAHSPFDALAAVGRILAQATQEVFLVDPYADANALTEFAVLVPEGISVRLLADEKHYKKGLIAAAQLWVQQYGPKWPLGVRLAKSGILHDRLIGLDGKTAFALGQSFNALATRSDTTLLRMDDETARLKLDAHEAHWQTSGVMV